jgi:hypothetical protein
MNRKSSRKSRFLAPGWLMFFSALLCVVLVPVVQATMQRSSEKSERERQLAEMTESQRLRIQHSFEEFQSLSPAEQESYRELDRRLNQDDLRLKETLASYQEFLSTLSPVERTEVNRATTLRERLNAIDRIQEERADLRRQLVTGMTEYEDFRSNFPQFDVLSADEMEAISQRIEDRLPAQVRDKVHLDSYTGPARFVAAVAGAYHAWEPQTHPGSRRELFEGELLNQIESAIQNKKIREVLAESDDDQERSRKLQFFLHRTIYRVRSEAYPDAAELANFMVAQDSEERNRLDSMPPGLMYRELGRKYLEQNKHPIAQAMNEFPGGRDRFEWRRRSGRGRGGRPDGRGDDNRDPDDDGRGRFNRNGERPSSGDQGAFNENRGGRGFRDDGRSERFGDRRRPEPGSSPGSD